MGYGAMRLPVINNNQAAINEPEAIRLIRYAIDHGVNYIDTAYTYHDGNSEIVVGKAIAGAYRHKVRVATKMPVYSVQTRGDLDEILRVQMLRLNVDYIDFYLFHALTRELWQKVKDLCMLEWAQRQIDKDRLGYLGFSFHDDLDVFKEIVDAYPDWAFCQIQYNYLDEAYQAGKAGLHYAADKGLAVVVMEPLAGGLLAVNPPAEIQKELSSVKPRRSPADWGLQWVWNQPEVSLALSGMNSQQQVDDNLKSADQSRPNSLTPAELDMLRRAGQLFLSCGYIGCTKCHYCDGCPQGIDIPQTLFFLNQYATKRRAPEEQQKIKQRYARRVPEQQRASRCLCCGQCEARCPQHLPVRRLMGEASGCLE